MICAAPGCKDDPASTPDAGGNEDAGPDAKGCYRPLNINSCIKPPNSSCKDKHLCLQCTCTGPLKVYACNGFTGDCRYFCTGCYPQTYTMCGPTAPKNILGLCSYCHADSGQPGKCDKLPKDGGTKKPDAGKAKDLGTKDKK